MKATKTADQYFAAISANVDSWYSGKINFDVFSKNQQRLWREIERKGMREAVQEAWRAAAYGAAK